MVFVIKKIIVSLVLLAFILPCFSFSSSAADLSWKDYISEVNMDNDTVTISLPVTPTCFDVYPSGLEMQSFVGDYLLYTFEAYEEIGREYTLQITPGCYNFLFLGNVPDDTEMNIMLDVRSVAYPEGDTVNQLPTIPVWNFEISRLNAHVQYFDSSHQRIALKTLDFGYWDWAGDDPSGESTTSQFYGTHVLKDPLGLMEGGEYFQNAQFMRTTYFLEGLRFSTHEEVKISVTNFDITLHMGSLVSPDGEYSDILEVILSELAKRGQTLDFITGEIIRIPTPVKPEGSEVVDNLIRFDTDFSSSAALGYDTALQFNALAPNVLADFGPALLAASSLIDRAASISFFDSLLVISISLGVFALLVNLVNQFFSSRSSPGRPSGDKSNRRSSSGKSKGG